MRAFREARDDPSIVLPINQTIFGSGEHASYPAFTVLIRLKVRTHGGRNHFPGRVSSPLQQLLVFAKHQKSPPPYLPPRLGLRHFGPEKVMRSAPGTPRESRESEEPTSSA
jgi:hypothetical protein